MRPQCTVHVHFGGGAADSVSEAVRRASGRVDRPEAYPIVLLLANAEEKRRLDKLLCNPRRNLGLRRGKRTRRPATTRTLCVTCNQRSGTGLAMVPAVLRVFDNVPFSVH
jgi:hypothetical protein